jgi:preprotein translocase subunit SecG
MILFLTFLHVLLCFLLMMIILLQPGKGVDGGAVLGGGGSSTIFGPRGPASLLSRATTIGATLFMVTSVLLAFYSDTAVRNDTDVGDEILKLQQDQESSGQVTPRLGEGEFSLPTAPVAQPASGAAAPTGPVPSGTTPPPGDGTPPSPTPPDLP